MKDARYMSDLAKVISAPIMQATIHTILGTESYDIIERPSSYILARKKEPMDRCKRIIILKPNGFTSNSLGELSSHPEASEAVIDIKGAVRPTNKGYFLIKNCIEYAYLNKDEVKTSPNYPYADSECAIREIKTSRTKFRAVRRNYYGFYHNLINLTNEWLVLVLDKKLNLSKRIDYSLIEKVGKRQKAVLQDLIDKVTAEGDGIFNSSPAVVERVCAMNPNASLPALITLLNIDERGKHEQCTVFAIILRISKKYPLVALSHLQNAEKNNTSSPYYLQELIKKIKKHSND